MHQEALAIRKQISGKQHSDYANSLYNLADLYAEQGHYKQALPLMEKAFKITKKALGEKHPTTKKMRKNYKGCKVAASQQGASFKKR